ncbi:MAG: hypothetical protein DRI91_06165 [Aquificota bacterium]|nr:MAG: hypothetical protein DRI91_06165 [Aquificota bacterium]
MRVNFSGMELVLVVFSLLLLLLEAFFSGSEIALLSSDLVRIGELAREGDSRAKKVNFFLKHPERLLGTTLLGTNLCVVLNASLITYLLSGRVGRGHSEWVTTLILSPMVLVFGEAIPKSLSQRRPTSLALKVVTPLSWAYLAFRPFSTSLLALARLVIPGWKGIDQRFYFTRDDLALLVEQEEGVADLEEEEKEIIHKVISLPEVRVRETMKPINQVVVLEEGETVLRAVEIFHKWGYSRVPVYSGHVYNVVGVVTIYDLLKVEDPTLSVSEVKRPAYFVPEYKRVDELLQEMKEERVPMAVVVDEYGAAIGITTVEDLVEELVGEIEDDFDRSLPHVGEVLEEGGGYLVDARIELDLLGEEWGIKLPKEDIYETIAGFLLYRLGRVPHQGEEVVLEGWRFRVVAAEPRRVRKGWLGRVKDENVGFKKRRFE